MNEILSEMLKELRRWLCWENVCGTYFPYCILFKGRQGLFWIILRV